MDHPMETTTKTMPITPSNASAIEVEKTTETTYSDDEESSLQTLPGSILDYVYENGRRYHAFKKGNYPYPNDQKECDRQDIIEHMVRTAVGGKLYLAPIDKSQMHNVLDIGCGTGLWCVQFADECPNARIVGTDLSPIQPEWVPPNVHFQVDDCEDTWSFREQFDFIRLSNLSGSLKSWPWLLQQAYKHLRPGGWMEISESYFKLSSADGSLKDDSSLATWNNMLIEASEEFGRSLAPYAEWVQLFENAGFDRVHQQRLILPLNAWAKDEGLKMLGRYLRIAIEEGLEALSMGLLTRVKEWAPEEVMILLANVKKDLRRRDIHAYVPYNITYGQKPYL